MLTSAQIDAAALLLVGGHLSSNAQQQWLLLVRGLQAYRDSPGLYPNLATNLSNATGVIAQTLQAALTQIESLGAGEISISKDVNWSLPEDRKEFIMDGLNALYDAPAQRPTSTVVHMRSGICVLHSCGYNLCGCRNRGILIL